MELQLFILATISPVPVWNEVVRTMAGDFFFFGQEKSTSEKSLMLTWNEIKKKKKFLLL